MIARNVKLPHSVITLDGFVNTKYHDSIQRLEWAGRKSVIDWVDRGRHSLDLVCEGALDLDICRIGSPNHAHRFFPTLSDLKTR